jgi:hypothetical protein
VESGCSRHRAEAAVVDLPVAIGRAFFSKSLKCGLNGFEGNDPAAVSSIAERLAELTDVCAHIDDDVNAAIFDKVDEIANAAAPEMEDAEALVDGP